MWIKHCTTLRILIIALLGIALSIVGSLPATGEPDTTEPIPQSRFHLTSRRWQPLAIPRENYLDVIEGICRYTMQLQDDKGAIIDPFLKREHQYATPYFAFAVGALLHAGKAADLLPYGIKAMEHATLSFAAGGKAIPDQHGEFFIPALTGALELYEGQASQSQLEQWRERLRTPLLEVIDGFNEHTNNWRAYAMKGEWMRAQLGLADRQQTINFIEESWKKLQRERMIDTRWNLYMDHSSDPEPQAVEAVGRGNLMGLIVAGYDGKSSHEIRQLVERGTRTYLLMQDPTGQGPPNGRADNHVWNDLIAQLGFEVMAEIEHKRGNTALASQYRRAAMLSYRSFQRWRRDDGEWKGSFYVTKNFFDPAQRIGYQPASQYTNYNGTLMMHLAEAFLARQTEIEEKPAPAEIGGYAFATDPRFASVFANAGGMQMMINLRGEVNGKYGIYWTPLGVARISRIDWESRLGPSDGVRDEHSKLGVTFAPTWKEADRWIRLADMPEEYLGEFQPEFISPALVRFTINYRPTKNLKRPSFTMRFIITPDGVLASVQASHNIPFGMTWPLLEDDGRKLIINIGSQMASVTYPAQGDEQNFIAVSKRTKIASDEEPVRSTYGWLRPLRVTVDSNVVETFIYPRNADEPSAEAVRNSFNRTANGFSSVLGKVAGNLYIGRTAAGGEGRAIDLNYDGKPDVTFSRSCKFILQHNRGKVTVIETDQAVTAVVHGKRLKLSSYHPVQLN